MNGPGTKYWSRGSGRKVGFGILIGMGIMVMVAARFFSGHCSIAGCGIGIGIIVVGLVGIFIDRPSPPKTRL